MLTCIKVLPFLAAQYGFPRLWGLSDRIAAIASLSAFLQFIALVVTVWIMIRNGRRQLRAYVVAESGAICNIADPAPMIGDYAPTDARITHPEWGPVATVCIKNTGQTPAYDVAHWGCLSYGNYPLSSPLPSKPTNLKGFLSVLGPGISISKRLSFGPPLTPDQIQQLMDGTGALYFHGEISYRDAFKRTHFTKYRLQYTSPSAKIGISTDLTFAEQGNDAN